MAIKLFNTLKSRLILLFGGLILVASVITTWLLSSLAVGELQKSTSRNLQEVAVQLRDKIEIDLHERYSDLRISADIISQSIAGDQSVSVPTLVNALQDHFPSYAWIGLVSPQGTVITSTDNLLEGMDVSARPWFAGAEQGPYLGDVHSAALLESRLENPHSTPLRFVDIAVPVHAEDGSLLGILGAHLYLDWVATIGQSVLAPLQERLEAELLIADRNGNILIGPQASLGGQIPDSLSRQAGANTSGYLRAPMAAGDGSDAPQDYLIGFSRLRDRDEYGGFNWLVMVRKSAATAFEPARELQLTLIAAGFAMALLLIVFASLAARWTARPLLKMTEEARNLDPEQPSTLIRQRDDYEEVKTLSSTLRNLILNLTEKSRAMHELNATLEQRVKERTRELENINALLEETVRTDALTGLKNRRHFFELGETAVKRAIRSGMPVTVIMIDIDHFKKVNDIHGHGVGDKALLHIGRVALNVLRDIDMLARLGGEEFAVLLENTDEEGGYEVAERLRSAIESSPLRLERGQLTITISAGVASFQPDTADELDTLLLFADRALYAAKDSGRNRVYRYSAIAHTDHR